MIEVNNQVHRCMIVIDSQAEFARELAETIAGTSGDKMWNTPLAKPPGSDIAYWISAGMISEEFANVLPLTIFEDGITTVVPGNVGLTVYLASKAGMQITPKQVEDLFESSVVTTEQPQEAMSRLGLTMVDYG